MLSRIWGRRQQQLADAVVILLISLIIESLIWTHSGPGDPISGPRWATSLLPLLVAFPLWWRRRRPLLVCSLVMSGFIAQAWLSGHAAEGLHGIAATGLVSFAVGRYASRRHAFLGLAVVSGGYGVWASADRNVRSGRASDLWAGAFFALYMFATWLIGLVLQARGESAAAARTAATAQHEAQLAVEEERRRIARDLHDIVSHNLSVVVVQAAGGRARVSHDDADRALTLERIESSGRQALIEMRRLLGVLRTPDEQPAPAGLAPIPGVDDLSALAATLRDAGVDVRLDVRVSTSDLSPAVDVSAYRIVQEALTNTLKYAGSGTRVHVQVHRRTGVLELDITDDGPGVATPSAHGHGLRGMQERVSLLGGEFRAGPLPERGFAVSARLPLDSA